MIILSSDISTKIHCEGGFPEAWVVLFSNGKYDKYYIPGISNSVEAELRAIQLNLNNQEDNSNITYYTDLNVVYEYQQHNHIDSYFEKHISSFNTSTPFKFPKMFSELVKLECIISRKNLTVDFKRANGESFYEHCHELAIDMCRHGKVTTEITMDLTRC